MAAPFVQIQNWALSGTTCLCQLHMAPNRAHEFLCARDASNTSIFELGRVQSKPRPTRSAWATYVQHLMCLAQLEIAVAVEPSQLLITAYVFDSIYVLAPPLDALVKSFDILKARVFSSTGLELALKTADGEAMVSLMTDQCSVQRDQKRMRSPDEVRLAEVAPPPPTRQSGLESRLEGRREPHAVCLTGDKGASAVPAAHTGISALRRCVLAALRRVRQ